MSSDTWLLAGVGPSTLSGASVVESTFEVAVAGSWLGRAVLELEGSSIVTSMGFTNNDLSTRNTGSRKSR